MGRRLDRFKIWLRHRSYLAVIPVAVVVVAALLFSNGETSMTRARELDRQIEALNRAIAVTKDSTAYYRRALENLKTGTDDLEKVARENYGMQRPTEDVYIVKD